MPNIQPVKSKKGAATYVGKDETRVLGPYEHNWRFLSGIDIKMEVIYMLRRNDLPDMPWAYSQLGIPEETWKKLQEADWLLYLYFHK